MTNQNRADSKFARSPDSADKQARAALLRSRGVLWRDIAEELGYASPSGASEAVRAFYANQPRQTIQDIRDEFRAKLEDLERMAREVMARKHYVVNEGQLVRGPHGEYLLDDGPIYTGLEIVRKQMETALKFLPGVASATKIQVITDDDIAAALEAERDELTELEQQGDGASG